MCTSIVRAAALLALLPVAAGAQQPLTEASALDRVSANSPRVLAIRASADIARADVLSAARWPNPRVTVNRESAVGVAEYISTIGQALPITGRRGLAVSAASARADAASSVADDDVRRVRAEVRLAFIEVVAATSRYRESGIAAGRVRELATVVARREAAGDVAGLDRLRSEREALNSDIDRVSVNVARTNAEAALAGLLSIPPGGMAVVPPNLPGWSPGPPPRQPVPGLEELIARAEATRGELRALQQEVASAEFAERAAIRGLYPEPEIVAGTKSSTAGSRDVGGVFAIHATMPIFDRARPERASARARATQARARAEVFRATLRTQLNVLRWTLVERREMADRYRSSAAANAELEGIALVSYEAGERGIQELLEVYRTVAAARMRQIDLDLAARRAEIELEFVSGWEIP